MLKFVSLQYLLALFVAVFLVFCIFSLQSTDGSGAILVKTSLDDELKTLKTIKSEIIDDSVKLMNELKKLKSDMAKMHFDRSQNDTINFVSYSDFDKPSATIEASNKLFLGMVPGFGPNNQYLATKELIWWAKLTGRTFVQPDYFIHDSITLRVQSIRPFALTFDREAQKPLIDTISMSKFAHYCNNTVDAILWMRKATDGWRRWIRLYAEYEGVTIGKELSPEGYPDHPVIRTPEDGLKYFSIAKDVRCLLIAFPFRNAYVEPKDFQLISRHLPHASHIVLGAAQAINEIGSSRETLLSWHWRWGETTCRAEPFEYHEGFDFCWGSQIFHWTTIETLSTALIRVLEATGTKHVYVSSDAPEDGCENAFDKLKARLKEKGYKMSRQYDIPSFKDMFDNYYRSLIEQEICTQSKVFIATKDSTWSDFVVDYLKATDNTFTVVKKLDEVLDLYEYPYTRRNCYNDPHQIPKNGAIIKNQNVNVKPTKYYC